MDEYKSYIEEQYAEASKRLKEHMEGILNVHEPERGVNLNLDEPEYPKEPVEDVVNHPKHYTQGAIECIQVIEYINKKLSLMGFEGFCLGNFVKYIWRCNDKNGWEDIDKAIFYLDKLLEEQTKK